MMHNKLLDIVANSFDCHQNSIVQLVGQSIDMAMIYPKYTVHWTSTLMSFHSILMEQMSRTNLEDHSLQALDALVRQVYTPSFAVDTGTTHRNVSSEKI
jgi:phenolic acid decarboxylase